jgi:hypothetical protein
LIRSKASTLSAVTLLRQLLLRRLCQRAPGLRLALQQLEQLNLQLNAVLLPMELQPRMRNKDCFSLMLQMRVQL